jgi:hypothetical protein
MKISEAVIGAKAGRLTIIRITGERNNHGKLIAECLCSCGNTTTATINNIGNKTNSCGCFKAEEIDRRLGHDIKTNSATRVLSNIKKSTPDTNLNIEMIINLIFSNCDYCHQSPNKVGTNGTTFKLAKERIMRVGIDRINNDIGYYNGNVVSCCYDCNTIKRDASIEFILQYFATISFNATKLVNGFKPTFKSDININIEHINNCQCYTNLKFKTSFEDRVCKIARMKFRSRKHFSSLNLDEIKHLIYADKCFYCERILNKVGGLYKRNGYADNLCSIRAFGIDRIDSNLGYVIDNVVPCCKDCNYMKRAYSAEHFSIATQNIYDKISILYNENKIMMGETL